MSSRKCPKTLVLVLKQALFVPNFGRPYLTDYMSLQAVILPFGSNLVVSMDTTKRYNNGFPAQCILKIWVVENDEKRVFFEVKLVLFPPNFNRPYLWDSMSQQAVILAFGSTHEYYQTRE